MLGIFHWLLLLGLLRILLRDWRIAVPVSLLAWVPWDPHFVGMMRGAMGELSVGTILASLLLLRAGSLKDGSELRTASILIVGLGAVLYADYLGFLPASLQLYEAGFSSRWMVLGVVLAGGWACYRGWWWMAGWIGLALLVWNLGCFASRNLWDHLMDVSLWIICIIHLCRSLCTKRS